MKKRVHSHRVLFNSIVGEEQDSKLTIKHISKSLKAIKRNTSIKTESNDYFCSRDQQQKQEVCKRSIRQKLAPLKKYQTKLIISAESWMVNDYRRDTYKRGWKPKQCGQFTGLSRLLMLKMWIQLIEHNPNISEIEFKAQTDFLEQEIQLKKQKSLSPKKRNPLIHREAIKRCLRGNTCISVTHLFYGLFMTGFEDLLEYTQIALGYLAYCEAEKIDPIQQYEKQHIQLEKVAQALVFKEYFVDYINKQILISLEMSNSKLLHSKHFQSTCDDISKLYICLEDQELFKNIIRCNQLNCRVRFQVGFNYWENQKLKLKNQRIQLSENHCILSWREKKNYAVIARNTQINIFTIMREVKFGMVQSDLKIIENWIKGLRKPIVEERRTQNKIFPFMKVLSEGNSQILKKTHLTRVKTFTRQQ